MYVYINIIYIHVPGRTKAKHGDNMTQKNLDTNLYIIVLFISFILCWYVIRERNRLLYLESMSLSVNIGLNEKV